jgi:putative exporter of polyketide antibiotics
MLLVGVAALSVLYAGGITAFYPTILENAERFEEMLSVYPKELMAAFGITGSLGDPGVFLNSYVFQFLWPLVAAIMAIALATRVAADADRGFLELPLSTPLPRVRYLASAVAGQVVSLTLLSMATIGAIWAVDLTIEPDFAMDRLALAGVHALAMGLAIAGPSTLLAVLLLDRGRAAGLAAGILVVMYLANVIAKLSPDLGWVGYLSLFDSFDLQPLIGTGVYPLGDSVLFLCVAVVGYALALVVFQRRDLAH